MTVPGIWWDRKGISFLGWTLSIPQHDMSVQRAIPEMDFNPEGILMIGHIALILIQPCEIPTMIVSIHP